MTQQREPSKTDTTYRFLHLSAEDLAGLPPEELLQACLEVRRLLDIVKGVLYTPDSSLVLRAVTIDLLFSEAERLSQQHGVGADSPVTQDIKTVSDRLGVLPASVRQAYEQLNEWGGVQIVARQFPRGPRQQHLPLGDT